MASTMPAWLPSYLFAGGFLAAALIVGVVVSFHPWFKNRHRSRPDPGQPTLFQARAKGPSAMSTRVGGLLHFNSANWLIWAMICGMGVGLAILKLPLVAAVSVTVIASLTILAAYLRPKGAVQSCYVDRDGAITLIRRGSRIVFDCNHFRYVRMYHKQGGSEDSGPTPGMLVLCRDAPPTPWTWLSSVLFPRVGDERIVLLCNGWRDADGYLVSPRNMATLFFQACERAGRSPKILEHSFGADTWEVRP